MNGLRLALVLLAVSIGIWLAVRRDRAPAPAPVDGIPGPTTTSAPALPPASETRPPRVIEGPFHGLAVQVFSADDALPKYGRLIGEAAELGAKCVMFSVNGYQERVDSTEIVPRPEECPSDDVWLQFFALTHGYGMKVILMPKILLTIPDGKWRGKIQPPSWEAWFWQYRKFILHFAELAERGQVEMFIVGSELVSSEKYTDPWKALIRDTRKAFSGLVAYSANWDHYTGIQFWEDLDVVGLTTYHNLADEPGPSLDELREAWDPIREKILTWRETVNRPILFTEVGWCSQEGCSVEPWNYYHKEEATPAGHEEQRRNYQAFIDTWAGQPGVVGMVWWEWTESEGGPNDFGYTPRGKPAEDVLRDFLHNH